ncbi:MAG: UDPGP type 1 family protein [Ruminococcus sp.]|nr:UDPGP type 1 family protein [Ruminococcus sp.]
MINYAEAMERLSHYGQQHILKYYDELSDSEKLSLLEQIECTDFSVIENLSNAADKNKPRDNVCPTGALTVEDIAANSDEYRKAGIEAIRAGKAAAVMLAGGQGTRLGFNKPKGMFNIGIDRELYIFECLINNLLDVVKETGTWVPLYIMTSELNNADTIAFFKEKNYFGYSPEHVTFFIQDMAPSVDFNGKVFLESRSSFSVSPNGNGGWFSSLVRAGLLSDIKAKGIEWINVFAVDNVLQRIADPLFIGAVINSGKQSGGKVVSKAAPEEKVGVLCLENGKPSIIEYYEMTDEMLHRSDENGGLAYRYGVILNYLFSVSKLEEICCHHMPVHVVEKKIPYMDDSIHMNCPEKPNGYKFETLVLDMVSMQDSCLVFEVERDREFAPVKNAIGVDSVDTARALLRLNGVAI